MDKSTIQNFIQEQIRKRIQLMGLDSFSIEDSTDLVREGIFDSLAYVDLIADCEHQFATEIKLENYNPNEFTKFGNLVEIIFESLKK